MWNKLFTLISIIIFFGVSCLQTSFAEGYKFDNLTGQKFETERLIITKTTEEDLDQLSEYLLNEDVTKYLDPDPKIKNGFKTKEEALEFLNLHDAFRSAKKKPVEEKPTETKKEEETKTPESPKEPEKTDDESIDDKKSE